MTFPSWPQIPTIDVHEAATGQRAGAGPNGAAGADDAGSPLLVDVRERNEFVQVRAPGAVLYPTSSFLLRFEELPRERPLHVICNSGSRSAAVTAWLLRNGWSDVHNVAGGMTAWVRAGLETRRGPLAPDEGDLAGRSAAGAAPCRRTGPRPATPRGAAGCGSGRGAPRPSPGGCTGTR